MANIYHWLTGSLTDVYSGVQLLQYDSTDIGTADSRYGSDSAFELGADTSTGATLYTAHSLSGDDDLPNLGTGDITVAFWWQPNSGSYGGSESRYLFKSTPGGNGASALFIRNRANYLDHGEQDSYGITAMFRTSAWPNNQVTKDFQIDLTGNPWIKVYASRINGVFNYTLFDATGSVLTDIDGNQATWSNSSYTNAIYDSSGSTPHILIGGNEDYGASAAGTYDDIFLAYGHGIAAADLETDSDGYAKIDPVINSFSTSATSATNGSSVTLSWDTDFGTTLQLLKYVGGLLTNTETVTGQVSKSVTISETVSYKLRATNVYGTVDSQSVQINLSQGGNNMAVQPVGSASGSLVIQRHHLIDTGSGSFGHIMMSVNPVDTANAGGGVLQYDNLNDTLIDMYSAHSSLSSSVTSVEVRLSEEESARASEATRLDGVDGSIETRLAAEESARASQDDIIEQGAGLDAGGTYTPPGSSNYLGGASLKAELIRLDTAIGNLATDFIWTSDGQGGGTAQIGGGTSGVNLIFVEDDSSGTAEMYMMVESV